MIRKIFISAAIFLISFGLSFSENNKASNIKYSYRFDDPDSIVESAYLMLKNADFKSLLLITELYEKRRVEKILDEISNSSELIFILKNESKKMISFEITGKEYITNDLTNQMVVVFTKWYVSNDTASAKNDDIYNGVENQLNPQPKRRKQAVIYVDYLLKKFDDKWKIISKRSK